jgi:hypothetical protein
MAKRPTKSPVTLIIRRIVEGKPVWVFYSGHGSMALAEATYNARIRGQGITAWAWWGPTRIAEKMLADPNYQEPAVMETTTAGGSR